MKIAKHGGNIYEVAEKLGIQPSEVLDFSANINPLGVPTSFRKALIENISLIESYPDPYYQRLIQAIGKYHQINPNYITVGNGATEIIFSMISALKPKQALILAPTFLEYERALAKVGCEVHYYRLKEELDFIVDEGFLKALHEEIDLVILCNPNNPTGQMIHHEIMDKILDRCREQRINLMIDEAFNEFLDCPDEKSMISRIESYKNLYIIRSLTKFFALPGLRIGYGISGNLDMLQKIASVKEPWTINSFAALAGEVVVKDQEYICCSKAWIDTEREFLFEGFQGIPQIKAYRPAANYILLKVLDDQYVFLQEKLLEKNILIRSCSNYENLNKSYFRVAIKDREANEKLIRALREVFYEG
ncbi:threonine-phosphate decarboxylase [Anaerosolibacter carboniphilus]|uniref:threonine-phosphate decarboxylase n=1 Tax=Anaerosolibacter carboniphilus TaxID=1417629 RepID=A0A841KL77_9FIRM|nr:threonine-phosphate decarboxylase CobD [Anaerosolibacter carboniphilus]MBB6214604.1 threonine-phosphate decarboxylase [Anaerosolibacter carboniphilus]